MNLRKRVLCVSISLGHLFAPPPSWPTLQFCATLHEASVHILHVRVYNGVSDRRAEVEIVVMPTITRVDMLVAPAVLGNLTDIAVWVSPRTLYTS